MLRELAEALEVLTALWVGTPAQARVSLEQSLEYARSQPQHASAFLFGRDIRVICFSYLAFTLWLLGYPAQASARSREALPWLRREPIPTPRRLR
jgi:hypothetical protein